MTQVKAMYADTQDNMDDLVGMDRVDNIEDFGGQWVGGSANVPANIVVPEYLRAYLESLEVPTEKNFEFLMDVGQGALNAKIAHVEEINMLRIGGKLIIPGSLNFVDVAIIMMSLFTFKSIQTADRAGDAILGMYVDDNGDNKVGTYATHIQQLNNIMERLAPSFKNKDMGDVLDKMNRCVDTVALTKDKNLFLVKNGIYNQETKTLLDFDPSTISLTKIPVDYEVAPVNPILTAADGSTWDVESWLADLMDNDKDSVELIWQVIADAIQPHRSRGKSVWFYSEKGNNGKGTVGQLIKNLLGVGNFSSLSVIDFNHEFMKETLLGSAANIADENDVNVFIDSVKDFKASITGDEININRKYEKPLRIKYLGTNIQMMNGLPKTKDKTASFYRRMIIVPFLKSFTNNGEKKYIKDDYISRPEVLRYVLHKALSMEFDEFIVPQRSVELMGKYQENNDPVLEFWNDHKDQFVWDLLPTEFLYDMFVKWFEDANPRGMVIGRTNFSDRLAMVIVEQGDQWELKLDRNDKVRVKTSTVDRMADDEPLISEYGLHLPDRSGKVSKWCNVGYKGDNRQMQRDFKRANAYRGLLRV